MGITVALTGSSGNMGRETLPALLSLPFVDKIKLLYINHNNERKFARKIKMKYGDRVEQLFGDVANYSDCESLVKDADYVVNLAAVIPPDSDHAPELTRLQRYGRSEPCESRGIHAKTAEIYPHFDCRGLRKQELSAPVGKGRRSAFAKRLRRLCRNEGKRRVDRA